MQARSRERLRRVLDAADEVLAHEGAGAFTTTHFEDLVAGVVEADEAQRVDDPVGEVLDVLVAGFRASPGFLGLLNAYIAERLR
jgi:hypothetical protein